MGYSNRVSALMSQGALMRLFVWLALITLALALIVAPVQAQNQTYIVQPGDTLYLIASRYGISVATLRSANGITGDLIYAGQALIVPASPGLASGAANYIVQPGDTLINIALRYGITAQSVYMLNHLTPPIVYIGQPLIVPGGTASILPSPVDTSGLPISATIANISGVHQALPLDCETRSAVDWAAFFGVPIDELTFFSQLPVSDHPDKGFVGDVHEAWGQIPPNAYGVHAEPIAALLRVYDLPATAHRGTNWNTVRAEVAANRPVIVWVTGHVDEGAGVLYTASDGTTTIVAPYEHTAMVIGYAPDSVTILDNDRIYTRDLSRFLNSWGALGNLAVIYN